MNIQRKTAVLMTGILAIVLLAGGCGKPVEKKELTPTIDLGTTIGDLVEVFSFGAVAAEGYGLVGGLNGTGSSECPPQVREYLEKYILTQLPEYKDIDKFISSHDTAVVLVRGIIPAETSKNQRFDVKVAALPGSQTTSLQGGRLYGGELYEAGRFGIALKALATVEGPVFIDTIEAPLTSEKEGYILAGGKVLDEYKVILALRQLDYRIAGEIRNRLNGRFGPDTAKAVSPSQVELKVPIEYKEQKRRFVSIVRATYLAQNDQVTQERIMTSIRELAVSEDKYESEIVLEAIGNKSVDKMAALLNSSDEEVRFRAARCMLNLGNDKGLDSLREIAINEDSYHRVEALEAITAGAARNDAASVSRRLLRDKDFDIVLAAYENLRKLEDIAITQSFIARNFYLEQIAQAKKAAIFVSRSGKPRIVLFGAPIYCRESIFVQSADGNITINASAGQKYVSIIRRHPKRPDVIVQLRSSFELGNIIQTLCEEPLKRTGQERLGLGVSYADVITLLKQMCDKGAIDASFRAGPLPKID